MDLICCRVVAQETVTTVELTDSAGAYIVLRIAHPIPEGMAVPEVGAHYDLVARTTAHAR